MKYILGCSLAFLQTSIKILCVETSFLMRWQNIQCLTIEYKCCLRHTFLTGLWKLLVHIIIPFLKMSFISTVNKITLKRVWHGDITASIQGKLLTFISASVGSIMTVPAEVTQHVTAAKVDFIWTPASSKAMQVAFTLVDSAWRGMQYLGKKEGI